MGPARIFQLTLVAALLLGVSSLAGPGETRAAPDDRLAEHLRRAFAHCPQMAVAPGRVLELRLPQPCRFADGRSAQGVVRFELAPSAPGDAPVRNATRRVIVSASPFTLDALQFEGALLEGLLDERETLTLRPRRGQTQITEVRRPQEPGKRRIAAAAPRDRMPDPIGDAARDAFKLMAAMPAVVSALGQELGRGTQREALKAAPELVALWVLTAPEPVDGGVR